MDYEIHVRIALAHPVRKIPERLSRFRLHRQSKTIAQNERFARELCRVFSRVLRSFPSGEPWIETMRELDLYDAGSDDCYPVRQEFSPEELRRGFLYFLRGQTFYAYNNLDLSKTRRLAEAIRRLDEGFYRAWSIRRMHRRARWFPAPLIRMFRQVTR